MGATIQNHTKIFSPAERKALDLVMFLSILLSSCLLLFVSPFPSVLPEVHICKNSCQGGMASGLVLSKAANDVVVPLSSIKRAWVRC